MMNYKVKQSATLMIVLFLLSVFTASLVPPVVAEEPNDFASKPPEGFEVLTEFENAMNNGPPYTHIQTINSPRPPFGQLRWHNEDFGWNHTFNPDCKILYNVSLSIRAYDVDWYDWDDYYKERDEVWVDGVFLGYLKGWNNQWSTTTFTFPNSWLADGALSVWLDIDANGPGYREPGYWNVLIDWSKLYVVWEPCITFEKDFRYTDVNFTPYLPGPDGILGTADDILLPAELGTLLPDNDLDGKYEVDLVIRGGKLRSTNPGQLYGVINITSTVPQSYFEVWDMFEDEFKVNPGKLGGGVEIIVVDGLGYATVLTVEPFPGIDAYMDANSTYLELNMTNSLLGRPLLPSESLMIYIKFMTTMRNKAYTGDDLFGNYVWLEEPGYDVPPYELFTYAEVELIW